MTSTYNDELWIRSAMAKFWCLIAWLAMGGLTANFVMPAYAQDYSAAAAGDEGDVASYATSYDYVSENESEYTDRNYTDRDYADSDSYGTDYSPLRGRYDDGTFGDRFQASYSENGSYRKPTSLAFANASCVLVPTLSGSVYYCDLVTKEVGVAFMEQDAAWRSIERLADSLYALTDEHHNRVVICRLNEQKLHPMSSLSAPGKPTNICFDPERRTLICSAQWAQRLYRWQATDSSLTRWSERADVDLELVPGQLLELPQHDAILVADAFGCSYAVVNREGFSLQRNGEFYGHNITSLACTADEEFIFFPHQLLNEYARTVTNDITWGGLMSNNIRWLRTDRVLELHGEQVFKKGKFVPLGTPGNGAGDPSSMSVSKSGILAVTIAGTNRVAIRETDVLYFRQVEVGYRPIDCAFTADEKQLVVLNHLSDSLSVVDLSTYEVDHLPLGPLREPTLEERGERLFFSSALSHDGWVSCHSCHSEGHTNGLLNDNFSDKTYGSPKRVLSLLGQADTAPYAWGGHVESLEEQVRNSISVTMVGVSKPAKEKVEAIAAFVRALPKPPSLYEARGSGAGQDELQYQINAGHELFNNLGCNQCHAGAELTTPDAYDVGLHDEFAMKEFNPPSLKGVIQRQNALFHDASASSLREVFQDLQHQIETPLTEADLNALLSYLYSL